MGWIRGVRVMEGDATEPVFGVAEGESEDREASRDSGRLNHVTGGCAVLEPCHWW